MNAIFSFLASSAGRVIRVISGIAIIAWGNFGMTGPASWIAIIIGLVPLLAGLFDFCVFAPLFRLPLGGEALRKSLK